jgi:phosphotriesterase-related protein
MSNEIRTVTGTVAADDLGRTLMHEHLMIGYPGWESDTLRPGPSRDEMLAVCVDKIAELQDRGVRTLLDPCPGDLGRDAGFMADVASKTGFNIICATGLYKEDSGGAAYWKHRQTFGDTSDAMAEMFIHELTVGIGDTGVRAGIIKVATGLGKITDYERVVLEAAAKASLATGAPITTHTEDGTCGDEQQQILTAAGVPAHRIIIGHSCGNEDLDYHMRIARGGSYLGFDRFGIEVLKPDAVRVASLLRLLEKGAGDRIVVSHDSVWCWRGEPFPDITIFGDMIDIWQPIHFFDRIIPKLREGGASEEAIERLLVDNPRRFFKGEGLAEL